MNVDEAVDRSDDGHIALIVDAGRTRMSQGQHDDVMITRKRRPEMWITCLAGREILEGAGRLHGSIALPGCGGVPPGRRRLP
jgi:hypothetical protein